MMNAITIRNLSDEASRALEARAAENGTAAELEAERILQDVLTEVAIAGDGASGLKLVDAFQKLGRDFPEFLELEFPRDETPARGASFE
jgi:plasmid stability protein